MEGKIVFTVLCFVYLSSCAHIDTEDTAVNHWALIVAGSSGWYNYRHQADACHAYHVMKNHGIPEDNIILMMYDDIAYNEENPTPGIVINHPEGKDVYGGVKIDYRREDVTPENFLSVMKGDKEAMKEIGTGRVIGSGPNDHVFVNFVDHGAPGILGFPTTMLHVKPFIDTINKMYQDKKFKQMVFYVEACESGSMFEDILPKDINVFATTAANAKESSYACYFDKELKTYLGDVYSVKWMEDSDKENLQKETLQSQFKIVKKETNTSHVQEYGEMSISKESVSQFQGGTKYQAPKPIYLPPAALQAVKSEDVPLAILRHRLSAVESRKEWNEIYGEMHDLLDHHQKIDKTFNTIVTLATLSADYDVYNRITSSHLTLSNYDCYQAAVDLFHQQCFNLGQHDYAMRGLYMLVNLCEEGIQSDAILNAIRYVCK